MLHEGLSLSQAARKHDIPYPTFVLYANRVHNMLGPSVRDGSPAIGGRSLGSNIILTAHTILMIQMVSKFNYHYFIIKLELFQQMI